MALQGKTCNACDVPPAKVGCLKKPAVSAVLKYRPSSELWEKYTLVEEVGEGSFGSVWTCKETHTGKVFACKVIRNAKDNEAVKEEIRLTTAVQGHDNIVKLLDIFEGSNTLYLLMELCGGGNLLDRINIGRGGVPEEDAKAIFFQIVTAVKHCHEHGVIHRDIKPENVLFSLTSSKQGPDTVTCKLGDFGLAASLKPGQKFKGHTGTFPYESPEVASGREYDHSADIWSLGVLLYAMLSAMWPAYRDGVHPRKLDEAVDWRDPCWRRISSHAKNLIRRLLAVDPAARPTASQILSDPWLQSRNGNAIGHDQHWLKLAQAWVVEAYARTQKARRSRRSSSTRKVRRAVSVQSKQQHPTVPIARVMSDWEGEETRRATYTRMRHRSVSALKF